MIQFTGIAYVLLIVLTVINSVNVKLAVSLQRWLTYSKLVAIAIVTMVGFVFLGKNGGVVHDNLSSSFKDSGVCLFALSSIVSEFHSVIFK